MKNPFPGMNPWLESSWRQVHAGLIIYARDQLQQRLPADLRAQVEEDVAIGLDSKFGAMRPDVHVTEPWESTGNGGTAVLAGAVATPGIRVKIDPAETRRIEIVDQAGVVITAVEFLSPTNKDGGAGSRAYRRKQEQYLACGVNLVEVDLLRRGAFMLNFSLVNLPARVRGAYTAAVTRIADPDGCEVFPIPLRAPLPVLPIPLRRGEPETTLELQPLVNLCTEHGGYRPSDYARPPDPPIEADDAPWVQECLRAAGLPPILQS